MLYFVEILGEEEVKKNAEELHQWLPIWIKTWLEHEIIEVESSRTLWGDICHTRPYFIGVQFCFQQNIRHSITQCNTVHTWWAIVDGAWSTHGNKHWVARNAEFSIGSNTEPFVLRTIAAKQKSICSWAETMRLHLHWITMNWGWGYATRQGRVRLSLWVDSSVRCRHLCPRCRFIGVLVYLRLFSYINTFSWTLIIGSEITVILIYI